jgi:ABC-2 type transport system ATP-binding protein
VGIIEKGRMVINESMETLLRRISRENRVRLRTLGGRDEVKIILDENPSVSHIQWDGEDMTFCFSGDDAGLHALLKNLLEKEIPIYSFEKISDSLESAYMRIMEKPQIMA